MSEAARDAPPADGLVGTLLGGRYRLVARLGEGGMGAVYRAEHVELEREVAVKVLAPELARNRTAIERFLREARTASRINHPNIVQVHDLGRGADGAPYLAMELLEGRDLADEIDACGGTLSPSRVIEVLGPVADALDVCHAKGVVHRDLKPSNVFLAKLDDGREAPKLVDFGLAMLLTSDERLTRTGTVAGTPHYMPPESARGALSGPLGDVYALATIAYRALSGVTPFEAELASGVLVQKLTDEPPAMAERAPGTYPAAVEAALARGLARDPAARPPSAGAFVRELREAIASIGEPWGPSESSSPVHAAPTSVATPARRSPAADVERAAAEQIAAEDSSWSDDQESSSDAEPAPRRPSRVVIALVLGAAALGATLLGATLLGPALLGPSAQEPEARVPVPIEPVIEPVQVEPVQVEPAHVEPAQVEPAHVEPLPPVPDDRLPDAPPDERLAPRIARPLRAPALAEERPTRPAPASSPTPSSTPVPAPLPTPPTEAASAGASEEAERLVRSAGSLLLRGDVERATGLLTRATRIAPSHAPAWRSLGLAHERAQRPLDARRAYERYLELDPQASDAARIRQRLAVLGG